MRLNQKVEDGRKLRDYDNNKSKFIFIKFNFISTLMKKVTPFRPLFDAGQQVSSVTMPASLPPQLADLHQKPSAPALTFFIRWTLKVE